MFSLTSSITFLMSSCFFFFFFLIEEKLSLYILMKVFFCGGVSNSLVHMTKSCVSPKILHN